MADEILEHDGNNYRVGGAVTDDVAQEIRNLKSDSNGYILAEIVGGGGTIGGSIAPTQIARGSSVANEIEGSAAHTFDGTDYLLELTGTNHNRFSRFANGRQRVGQTLKYQDLNGDADFSYVDQTNYQMVDLRDTDYAIDDTDSDTDNGKFFVFSDLTQDRVIRLPLSPVAGYRYKIGYFDTTSSFKITIFDANGINILGYNTLVSTLETNVAFSTLEIFFNGVTWTVGEVQGEWAEEVTRPLVFDAPSRQIMAGEPVRIDATQATDLYRTIIGCDPSSSGSIDVCNTPFPNSIIEALSFNVYNNNSTVDLEISIVVNGTKVQTITIAVGFTGIVRQQMKVPIQRGDLVCLSVISTDSSGSGRADLGIVNSTVVVISA